MHFNQVSSTIPVQLVNRRHSSEGNRKAQDKRYLVSPQTSSNRDEMDCIQPQKQNTAQLKRVLTEQNLANKKKDKYLYKDLGKKLVCYI